MMPNKLNRRAFMGTAAATAFAATSVAPTSAKDAYSGLDAIAQAALVRERQTTALELVDAAIARIEAVNPRTDAVVAEYFDKARAQAKSSLPRGPLSGMPYLIKDLVPIKGEITTSGSRLMARHIGETTGLMPQKAIDSGMIVVGKTNTPEFGLLATTEGLLLGAAHNPWNLDYSTGGSSGGAAAAVASGMLPVAHASDGGGSIRIPASCCGVFGLKPSRGRMDFGAKEKMPGDIAVENCVSRTVRDSAMIFALSEDVSPKAAFKPTGFVGGPSKRRLKIAFGTLSYYGAEPDPDVKTAVEATAKLCQSLGHTIVEAKNPVQGEAFIDAFLTVWASGPAQLVALARSLKLKPEDVLEPWTLGLADYYAKKPKDALAKSLAYFRTVEKATDAFLAQYDAWLTPVLASPPPRLGEQAPTVPFDTLYARVTRYVAYTPLHNVAGTPAMSVPLGMSKDGLPIGSQFAAAKGGEGLLYALAYELEQAQPWAGKRAPVWAG
ncbi:MAG TPA: amidase [Rhizomicrobium sp.]|jgi:amidase|nr:amidase [Rhizomicrobium sp.]